MKGLTKSIVALALVIAVLATMGMSAMAEKAYSTKTIYQADNKISVEAKAAGLEPGDIVTYVATTDEADVNENTIVYINQDEADAEGKAKFTYTTEVTNINASMFFGGSTENTRQSATAEGGFNVTVKIGENQKVVSVLEQADENTVVVRKFDLSGIANFSAADITEVKFNGATIGDFAVADTTLIVSTDKINADGTLAITTKTPVEFADPKISTTTKLENNTLVAVAKAPAGEKFGIVLYKDGAQVVIEGTVKTEDNYVVLPALGKNVDGIYAIELQGVNEYLAAPFNVKAYAYNGTEYKMSENVVAIQQ